MISLIKYSDKSQEAKQKLEFILNRNQLDYGNVQNVVDEIIADIRKNKNQALFKYTEQFDKIKLDENTVKVTKEEIEEAYTLVDKKLIDVIKNIDLNALSNSLTSLEKVLNVVNTFIERKEPEHERKWYDE